MTPEIRRIVAVEAHRRRTGRCATLIHSLGTGETYEIAPTASGFRDLASGLSAQMNGPQIRLPDNGRIDLDLVGDIGFSGYDHTSDEAFTGRAGGGSTVTIYDAQGVDYFQYAIDEAPPLARIS